jgi:hypothetical protein
MMTWRFPCWTLGLALLATGTLAGAQTPPPQEAAPPHRLRIEVPPPRQPLDVTSPTGRPQGLRTLATCLTCPTNDDRAPVTASIAPWRIGAFYTVGDTFNHVTFGVVGQRNERLPLFMSVPIGAPVGPAPPPSIATTTLDTRTRWLATVAGEKTLGEGQSGRTLGVVGEAFLPFRALGHEQSAATGSPSSSGRAVRGGLRVLF